MLLHTGMIYMSLKVANVNLDLSETVLPELQQQIISLNGGNDNIPSCEECSRVLPLLLQATNHFVHTLKT